MSNVEESQDNALIIVEELGLEPIDLFDDKQVEKIIDAIEEKCITFKAVERDIDELSDRKAIASFAYKVAKTKTLLDDVGKKVVEEWKQNTKRVDGLRKKLREELDRLKHDVRAPLTQWEADEEQRKTEHEEAIARINELGCATATHNDHAALVEFLALVESGYNGRDWQEYQEQAATAYKIASESLTKELEARKERDAEREELDRLRREAAEREKERDAEREELDRLRREAAEREKGPEASPVAEMSLPPRIGPPSKFEEAIKERRDATIRNARIAIVEIITDRWALSMSKLTAEAIAEEITTAIERGEIPHVSIHFE